MSQLRLKTLLAAWTLVLALAPVASAQRWQPFGPVDWDQYHDRQPFAPPDLSEYDLGPPPKNGLFVTFERLYWAITAPDKVQIGVPNVTAGPFNFPGFPPFTVTNTADTGFLAADFVWGNRLEFGYRDGKHGWLATLFNTNSQWQLLSGPDQTVIFDDPDGFLPFFAFDGAGNPVLVGPIPPIFSVLNAQNVTRMNGVEVLHTYRFNPGQWGGDWEFFLGARYMEFNDRFTVTTFANAGAVPEDLDGSFWNTEFQNNMVGPEIGARMAHRRERWTFVTEGRFTAAANFINAQQDGAFFFNPSIQPNGFRPNGNNTQFASSLHEEAFSPIVELRIESSYQLTKAIAFKFGYTAMWINDIARASNRIIYQVPDMGIISEEDRESVFVNGVTFGIEINR